VARYLFPLPYQLGREYVGMAIQHLHICYYKASIAEKIGFLMATRFKVAQK
jgi:hypothetical protein